MSFRSSEIRHILTEHFTQINIIVTNDLFSSKKKKGDLNFIVLPSETLGSSAVATHTMHQGS